MSKFHLTILLFLASTFAFAQKSDLSLKLDKGTAYKMITNANSEIVHNINGMENKINMKITGEMTYKVKDITTDGYKMDVMYNKVGMVMEMQQGKMEFSSDKKDETDIHSNILSKIVEIPFQITMSKSGRISNIRNIEGIWDNAFSSFTKIPEAQLKQIKALLLNAYGEKAFKGYIEMVSAIFPEKKVKLNEEWEVTTRLESVMQADIVTKYRFASRGTDYYLIKGEATMQTDENADYIENSGMMMKNNLTGLSNSEIKVDKNTGWIQEAKIIQKMEGDAHIQSSAQIKDGMTIPMVINSETLITD